MASKELIGAHHTGVRPGGFVCKRGRKEKAVPMREVKRRAKAWLATRGLEDDHWNNHRLFVKTHEST